MKLLDRAVYLFSVLLASLMAVAGTVIFCISIRDVSAAIDEGVLPPCVLEAFLGMALLIVSFVVRYFINVSDKKRDEL